MKETQQAEAVGSRLTRPDQTRAEQHSKEWASCAIMEKREREQGEGSLYLYAVELLLLFWAAKKKCAAKSENQAKVLTALAHA